MPSTYVTIQGDRLDQICRRFYGTERNGNVEAVIDANGGLAGLGPIYQAGISIIMPDITQPSPSKQVVSLWS